MRPCASAPIAVISPPPGGGEKGTPPSRSPKNPRAGRPSAAHTESRARGAAIYITNVPRLLSVCPPIYRTPVENFSSFPPEEEQQFVVYEERMQTAARSSKMIGIGVAAGFGVLWII